MKIWILPILLAAAISCSSPSDAPLAEPTVPSPSADSDSSDPSNPAEWTEASVHSNVIQAICASCHSEEGLARRSELTFTFGSSPTVERLNLGILDGYILSTSAQWVLAKSMGSNEHGGGMQLTPGSDSYNTLKTYLEQLLGERLDTAQSAATHTIEAPEVTYRRASLLLTGLIPSEAKLASIKSADDSRLKQAILLLMQGRGFHNFLKRGANDQLLVRSLLTTGSLIADFQFYYPIFHENYRRASTVNVDYAVASMTELAEAPLELIAHVVQNDLPYTEVLTANYTMVSSNTADIYKTGMSPAAGEFVAAQNKGQHVSGNSRKRPYLDWRASRGVTIPHAGILTEPAYLQQYPTTATNRNRARARWTYLHFLGFDIEASAARTISDRALRDLSNPTLNNDACTVCHAALDPVAGAFQNFSERGIFRAGSYGSDSLDPLYKKTSLYSEGDIWYSDMLPPGYYHAPITSSEASLQELAQHIATDPRFAAATVKFWWPAVFGEPLLADNLSTHQYKAKVDTLGRLSNLFIKSNYNLRFLLTEMILSDWFRADHSLTEKPVAAETAVYTGGKRLLTPEELSNKTASLTGIRDSSLFGDMVIMYGGIDSFNAKSRQRELSHMMLRAAERHALSNACTIVASEFNTDQGQRKLFTLVQREDTPGPRRTTRTVLTHTQPTVISHTLKVQAMNEQKIHFTATALSDAHTGYSINDVSIETIEVIAPDGSVVLIGDAAELFKEHDWVSGTPVGNADSQFRVRRTHTLNLEIPVNLTGEYRIDLTVRANTAGNFLDIDMTPTIFLANSNDDSTIRIREQIAHLLERGHGKKVTQTAPDVLAYTQLFLDLRANKLRRGANKYLTENNIRCHYHNANASYSSWAADPAHTLTAWRGILVALMTDFSYIFE